MAFNIPNPKSIRELEAGLARRGFGSVTVFEQQHPEAIEPSILQREAIFRFVHAEAARAARARGKEDVVIQNLVPGQAFLLKELKILHQISYGAVSGITLAVVAKLLTSLEGGNGGNRNFSQR